MPSIAQSSEKSHRLRFVIVNIKLMEEKAYDVICCLALIKGLTIGSHMTQNASGFKTRKVVFVTFVTQLLLLTLIL